MGIQDPSKKIMSNTILLYIRMVFVVIIGFYTSRVILEVLGVADYGVYSIVGSVVTLFTFLSTTMSSATSRFITYSLGKGINEDLRDVFNTSIRIHLVLSLLIVLLSETIGLYLINHHLNIDSDRLFAAKIVYQISIIICVISVLQIPFQASVIGSEKMGVYSIISILDAFLKLVIIYFIDETAYDKLILYAFLLLVVSIITLFLYFLYSVRYLPGCNLARLNNRRYVKPMLSFSGWDLFGNLSSISSSQGINFLLNINFGIIINAALGLAFQFRKGVSMFANNFLNALRPQIVKLYAQGEYAKLINIIYSSSLLTNVLLLIIVTPLYWEMDYILKVWLEEVPNYLGVFCKIFIIQILLSTTWSSILTMLIHAIGNMKKLSLYRGTIILLALPVSWLALFIYKEPIVPIMINAVFDIIAAIYTIYLVNNIFPLIKIRDFAIRVFIPSIVLMTLSFMLGYIYSRLNIKGSVLGIVTLIITNTSVLVAYSFIFLLSKDDIKKTKSIFIH